MLALYILKSTPLLNSTVIKEMSVSIKRLAAFQGILIPNCLHIVDFIHENKYVDIFKLITFLTKQTNTNSKNIQSFYSGLQSTPFCTMRRYREIAAFRRDLGDKPAQA